MGSLTLPNVNFRLVDVSLPTESVAGLLLTNFVSFVTAFLVVSLTLLFVVSSKSHVSARLLAYKCALDGSLSLPTFCRFVCPCFVHNFKLTYA